MNGLFELLGIQAWKPILTALILPPVPFLVLLLVGARLILPRRGLGWFLIVLSVAGLWLAHCTGAAPRSSGRREPWMLSDPSSGARSTSSGRICPYATTTEMSGSRDWMLASSSSPRALSG